MPPTEYSTHYERISCRVTYTVHPSNDDPVLEPASKGNIDIRKAGQPERKYSKYHLPLAGPTAGGHGTREADDVRHEVPGLDARQQLKCLLPSITIRRQRRQHRAEQSAYVYKVKII